jgi:serine phosphatase RsbU (regulator of sigma subunit)
MDFPTQQAMLNDRSLYLFSDGVTDARDTARNVLGVHGVVDLIVRHVQWRPETRLRRIVGELRRRELGDDTTLLIIEAAA